MWFKLMINLEQTSGLPVGLSDDYKLKFEGGLPEVEFSARKFSDVQSVLMDPAAKSDREEMYFMYRDVHFTKDQEIIRANKIRYDITVIPPAKIGSEFTKTVGHYHSLISNSELAYPEAYEVICGHALFLIQKLNADGTVNDVIAIQAKAGDKVVYLPNYGHIIVNIGNEPLVTSNWVSDQYTADYGSVAEKHGMAYYVVAEANGYKFVANGNYGQVPAIKAMEAGQNPAAKLLPPGPMYPVGVSNPEKFEFLNNPEKYLEVLSS